MIQTGIAIKQKQIDAEGGEQNLVLFNGSEVEALVEKLMMFLVQLFANVLDYSMGKVVRGEQL